MQNQRFLRLFVKAAGDTDFRSDASLPFTRPTASEETIPFPCPSIFASVCRNDCQPSLLSERILTYNNLSYWVFRSSDETAVDRMQQNASDGGPRLAPPLDEAGNDVVVSARGEGDNKSSLRCRPLYRREVAIVTPLWNLRSQPVRVFTLSYAPNPPILIDANRAQKSRRL